MTQQREIKFRVWQTDAKKWAELGTLFVQDNTGALKIPGFYPGLNGRPSCQYILSQYTGLKDAEIKEIYEGDIIEDFSSSTYKHRSLIVWHPMGFCCADGWQIHPDPKQQYLKILGNIFENPELLEK